MELRIARAVIQITAWQGCGRKFGVPESALPARMGGSEVLSKWAPQVLLLEAPVSS